MFTKVGVSSLHIGIVTTFFVYVRLVEMLPGCITIIYQFQEVFFVDGIEMTTCLGSN